jgi:hypothetical protein
LQEFAVAAGANRDGIGAVSLGLNAPAPLLSRFRFSVFGFLVFGFCFSVKRNININGLNI